MERSEFEEKEYENPLYNQLLHGNNNVWTPGQVFEEYFGIDSAVWTTHTAFWDVMGYLGYLNGAVINHFNWGYIWKRTGDKRYLPDFKLNLFIQAKRPEFLYGKNIEYSKFGITGPYLRFFITDHQQLALEKLSQKLGHKGLVTYACPAFHTHKELFYHTRNNSIIDNSSFVKASRLTGHQKWVFDQPGTIGLGCSQIERIKEEPFNEQINIIVHSIERTAETEGGASQSLFKLESIINEVILSIREESPIADEFFRRDSFLTDLIPNERENLRYIRAYLRILMFTDVTNLNWFVLG